MANVWNNHSPRENPDRLMTMAELGNYEGGITRLVKETIASIGEHSNASDEIADRVVRDCAKLAKLSNRDLNNRLTGALKMLENESDPTRGVLAPWLRKVEFTVPAATPIATAFIQGILLEIVLVNMVRFELDKGNPAAPAPATVLLYEFISTGLRPVLSRIYDAGARDDLRSVIVHGYLGSWERVASSGTKTKWYASWGGVREFDRSQASMKTYFCGSESGAAYAIRSYLSERVKSREVVSSVIVDAQARGAIEESVSMVEANKTMACVPEKDLMLMRAIILAEALEKRLGADTVADGTRQVTFKANQGQTPAVVVEVVGEESRETVVNGKMQSNLFRLFYTAAFVSACSRATLLKGSGWLDAIQVDADGNCRVPVAWLAKNALTRSNQDGEINEGVARNELEGAGFEQVKVDGDEAIVTFAFPDVRLASTAKNAFMTMFLNAHTDESISVDQVRSKVKDWRKSGRMVELRKAFENRLKG